MRFARRTHRRISLATTPKKEAEPFALKKAVGSPFLFSSSLRCVLDTLLNLWYNMAEKNDKGESL
jgi:hypothetical protein